MSTLALCARRELAWCVVLPVWWCGRVPRDETSAAAAVCWHDAGFGFVFWWEFYAGLDDSSPLVSGRLRIRCTKCGSFNRLS